MSKGRVLMSIKIKLAKEHQTQANNKDVKRELDEMQKYFDDSSFEFGNNTITYVLIRGYYSDIDKAMNVVGVFVNNTNQSIYGLRGKLELNFKNKNAQIAVASLTFPEEFLGEVKVDEGVIMHITIPVRGLSEDGVFTSSDIEGRFSDIEYIKR